MFLARKNRLLHASLFWTKLVLGACLGLGLGCPSWAQENAEAGLPGLSLHGFGTLGLTRSNTDQAQFVRDLSQPLGAGSQWTAKVDSLFGLQANLDLSPSTQAVLQIVTRYHGDQSYQPELTWAFLRHDFSSDFSLRAGRLGTEFYMLGDSRLVGYSNVSVRPPPDFYGALVFSYIDGLDLSLTRPLGAGLLKGKLFAGQSPETTPYAPGILWDLQGSSLVGGYLDYSSGPWQFRLSHAQVRFKHEMPVDELLLSLGNPLQGLPYLSLVPQMAMAGQSASFNSLGLVFDQGPLNVQLMLNQVRHESAAYADASAAYLLAAYRLGALTPYVGVSRSFTEDEALPRCLVPGVVPCPVVDALTASLVAQSRINQTTWTLGSRWDLQKNLALKAQLDWVRGQPSSKFLFKDTQAGWDGRMTVLSLALDFVF